MSFDLILPFLRPIAHLILDPTITEVMVNGSGRIFIEREGQLAPVTGITVREQNLRVAVRNLARAPRTRDLIMARRKAVSLPSDPCWYRDAVIYQLHVKSFFDSNNDGVGDFPGLIKRLDYLAEVGINALWLLPFYSSPRRDQ